MDVNDTSSPTTPLHWAAEQGKTSIVKLFLDKMVGDKNPKNKPGFKVIIHKSRGEQDTIECVFLAHSKYIFKFSEYKKKGP